MSGLAGKSVIVTGSSSGIGETTAIRFASKGCNVTLCGRDSARLQDAAEKCKQAKGEHPNRFITVAGDMTDSDFRKKVLEDTQAAFGGIDVLVINHGVAVAGTFDELSEKDFDTTINTNLKSYVFLIKDAVSYLKETKGSIVCVSSVYSKMAGQKNLPNFLGKAAMDHMVRCLTLELGPKGIRINAVNPTLVQTRLSRETNPESLEARRQLFEAATPLAGQSSGALEQADVITFLASEDARFITGQCVAVDGGLSCKGNPMNWLIQQAS